MRLPESARADLLEFVGATPVADSQLSAMIDAVVEGLSADRLSVRFNPN